MGLDQYLNATKTVPDDHRITALMQGGSDDGEGGVYLSGYDFYPEEKQQAYRDLVAVCGVEDYVDPGTPSAMITRDKDGLHASFAVGYWRKANQIHNWFVENVQGGEDECNPFPVSRDQLATLRSLCVKVMEKSYLEQGAIHVGTTYTAEGVRETYEDGMVVANPDVAEELLPTARGFFFGGTDYDEWYLRDLEDTITIIDRVFKMPEEWTFIYRSSW